MWTLRVRDQQDNGKTGTFYSWSMQLWGSAIDADKAKPYELPDEEDMYPNDPLNTGQGHGQSESDDAAATMTTTTELGTTAATETTKAYVKPTVHLPDDHAEATGEAHSSFGEAYPTPPAFSNDGDDAIAAPKEEDVDGGGTTKSGGSSSLYDQTEGYLAGLSTLVGSTTWLFVAFGTIVIFVAGATAFLVLRRRRATKLGGGRRGGGGRHGSGAAFDFLPQSDFDDEDDLLDGSERLPMSAMERGGGGRRGSERVRLSEDDDDDDRRGGRTRELFNAFALDSDDDGEDEDDRDVVESDGEGHERHTTRTRSSAEEEKGGERYSGRVVSGLISPRLAFILSKGTLLFSRAHAFPLSRPTRWNRSSTRTMNEEEQKKKKKKKKRTNGGDCHQ